MSEAAGLQTISSTRLVGTLGVAGAAAGLLLVFVFQTTQPAIQAHKARMLELAIDEVLGGPARTETLYVVDGALVSEPPADAVGLERVYHGLDPDGRSIGYALVAAEPGFQDMVRLIFGYDPATRRVLGMKVLESKETPGLGDKIEKDESFIEQFRGVAVPIVGVKAGTRAGPDEVDMITGATISARAVIRIIDNALERVAPMLETHQKAIEG